MNEFIIESSYSKRILEFIFSSGDEYFRVIHVSIASGQKGWKFPSTILVQLSTCPANNLFICRARWLIVICGAGISHVVLHRIYAKARSRLWQGCTIIYINYISHIQIYG